MTANHASDGEHYREALAAVDHALEKYRHSSDEEKAKLRAELAGLRDMHDKLQSGRVEIVVFGEISTGKSALINALVGQAVASVDVRGGWTKEIWHVPWDGTGYILPGLGQSQVVLVDTPGINEVGGDTRGQMAREAAQRADLILFVTDSDLNETEHTSLLNLSAFSKPMLVVLNKIDLYSREQQQRLLEVLAGERLKEIVPPEQIITAAADPRDREYIIQSPDGKERSEWRKPEPDVIRLKEKILELLDREGLALIALNAALYAADKTDRIAALRVQLRQRRAAQIIWSYATVKAIAVGLSPIGYAFADIFGGMAVDAAMIVTLARVYGLELSWQNAHSLALSIAKAGGWMTLASLAPMAVFSVFKSFTLGQSTLITALPQGAAAGYGSFIVGESARFYFEHGSSWGGESPKAVVQRILASSDKQSIIERLREEIRRKLLVNPYSTP